MARAITAVACNVCDKDDQIKISGTGYVSMVVCNRRFAPGGVIGHGVDDFAAIEDWNNKVIEKRQQRAIGSLPLHTSNLARFACLLAAGFSAEEASREMQARGFALPEGVVRA